MTSILQHLEDINLVCQKLGLHFLRHINKELESGILISGCIPITLLKGVVYKKNSREPMTEPCGTPNSNLHNFSCLEMGWLR